MNDFEYSNTKLPILLITFCRIDTTLKIIDQIRKYTPTRLYIASDGGRENKQIHQMEEKEWVLKVREQILQSIDWDCEIKTFFHSTNQGCKMGVSSAISWFFQNEEMGIILEDDCLPNSSFFRFCEEMLKRYQDHHQIFMISGWSALDFAPSIKARMHEDYYFSKYNHIWGWASYRRAWQHYEEKLENFKEEFQNFTFDTKEEKTYWYKIFKAYKRGKIDAWDYPWTYSIWKHGGLSIYPKNNMIQNIGFNRDDAVHCKDDSIFAKMTTYPLSLPLSHPKKIQRNAKLDQENFKIVSKRPSILIRIINKIRRMLFSK